MWFCKWLCWHRMKKENRWLVRKSCFCNGRVGLWSRQTGPRQVGYVEGNGLCHHQETHLVLVLCFSRSSLNKVSCRYLLLNMEGKKKYQALPKGLPLVRKDCWDSCQETAYLLMIRAETWKPVLALTGWFSWVGSAKEITKMEDFRSKYIRGEH